MFNWSVTYTGNPLVRRYKINSVVYHRGIQNVKVRCFDKWPKRGLAEGKGARTTPQTFLGHISRQGT